MRIIRLIGRAVMICLVMASMSYAQRPHGPQRVEVAKAVEREIAPTIRLVGTVRPRLRSTIAAGVSGRVANLPVDVGDLVAEGDLLCKLRDAPRRFSYQEAVARMSELEADLSVQKAELKKAEFEKKRTERLWKLNRSTPKELNDTQADFEAAEGRVRQAQFAIKSQKAVVDRLADELARTEIRAPFDGYVSAKHTELGEWLDEGGDVAELLDLSTARVRVNVPEMSIGFCHVGADAYVTIEALRRHFPGKISRVIPDADERARTFPVDIDIPNPKARLKAGMFVRASVPAGEKKRQLLIPKDAVLHRGGISTVYVVRTTEMGQRADVVVVKVLSEVLDYVAVRGKGLSAGDSVIVRGNENMRGPGPVIATPRREPAISQKQDLKRSNETPKKKSAVKLESLLYGAASESRLSSIRPTLSTQNR